MALEEQERLLIEVAARLRSLEETVKMQTSSIDRIVSVQVKEATLCPFNPAQGTNGHKALDRLGAIESEMTSNRSYLKGIWVGLGALGLIQLPNFLGILQALFIK